MTASTDFDIQIVFDNHVSVKRVASSTIQKEEKKKRSRKVLGSTSPSMAITDPVLTWEVEGDPKAGDIVLRLLSIQTLITFSTTIKIDKDIDKATTCYAEVKKHEVEHVKIWRAGVKRYGPKIAAELETLFARLIPAEETIPGGKLAARKQRATDVLRQLVPWSASFYGEKISKESRKLDSKDELDRIQDVCGLYLMTP